MAYSIIIPAVAVVTITSIMMIMLFSLANAISSPSSSTDEAKALRSTGWWNSTSAHCDWDGVYCNNAGRVTQIDLSYSGKELGELSKLEFSSFPSLVELWLADCGLNGTIPHQIGTLTQLTYLSLGLNNLTGELPLSLANLPQLEFLYLYSNRLHGSIPPKIGKMKNLIVLYLHHNNLTGVIPSSFGNLTNLTYLYLDSNQISGFIPPQIGKMKNLKFLSLSYNGLHGSIPPEIGKLQNLNYLFLDYNNLTSVIPSSFGNLTNLIYLYLDSNQISGGCLEKLHGWERDDPTYLKSFENEVQMLSRIQHRNIVKLHGFCLHNKCMFLVYKYMEKEVVQLDWIKRVNVVKGIANALSYMHHDSTLPIIHRDISSNNILLDSKLEAFVADFGTARLLDPDSSNQTLLAGTYGYIAPALETIMGKHPGDLVTSLSSSSTQNITLKDVLDSGLSSPKGPQVANDVALVVSLALKCLHCNPRFRPSMQQVSWRLSASKSFPQPVGAISLCN
ncbi:hypothetical protein AAG906_019848 [Vitis piasezkii]